MKSLVDYDIKILIALLQSLKGRRDFFKFLVNNGYPELAAWSNAVRGDEEALHWLFDNGYGILGVLSNAIDGEKKAVQWVMMSKDEFLINFSAACRKEEDGMRWLKERDLEIHPADAAQRPERHRHRLRRGELHRLRCGHEKRERGARTVKVHVPLLLRLYDRNPLLPHASATSSSTAQ